MDTTTSLYTPSRMFRIRKRIHDAPLLSVAGLLSMAGVTGLVLSLAALLAYRQFTAAAIVSIVGLLGYHTFLAHRTSDYLEGLWLADVQRFEELERDFHQTFDNISAQPSARFFDAYYRAREILDAGFVPHTTRVCELSSELATASRELLISGIPFRQNGDQS